jgi:hypothetical protein
MYKKVLVGVAGFEPAAFDFQSGRNKRVYFEIGSKS